MLKFRTTKEVQTSLHTDETHLLEFRFRYYRDKEEELGVKCDAYAVIDDDNVVLIPGGGKYDDIPGDTLSALMSQAVSMTPFPEDPLEALNYIDALIANGIKLYIITNPLWRNVLTINDFE